MLAYHYLVRLLMHYYYYATICLVLQLTHPHIHCVLNVDVCVLGSMCKYFFLMEICNYLFVGVKN